MKLIIIDRKAWERHCSEFADFIHSIEQLIGNPPETDEWLDNEAVSAGSASASAPCNPIATRVKYPSPSLGINAIIRRATSQSY